MYLKLSVISPQQSYEQLPLKADHTLFKNFGKISDNNFGYFAETLTE